MNILTKHYRAATAFFILVSLLSISGNAFAADPTPAEPPAVIDLGVVPQLPSFNEFHRVVRNFYSDSEGLNLTDYDLQVVLQGSSVDGKLVQVFYKDQQAKNIYSRSYLVRRGEPIRFDPQQDPREINEFSDFTRIFEVGAKVYGLPNEATDIEVTAKLIHRQKLPRENPPPPQSFHLPLSWFVTQGDELFLDARYQAIPGLSRRKTVVAQ